MSCAPAMIADRRGCRIARQVRDDVPRDATRRLVRRAEREGDAHARGRCLAARRAPGHCSADLVVGRRRRYRLCGHRDDVRRGSGPLHAPAPPITLTLAAVNWAEAGFPNAALRDDSIGPYPRFSYRVNPSPTASRSGESTAWAFHDRLAAARTTALGRAGALTPERPSACSPSRSGRGFRARDRRRPASSERADMPIISSASMPCRYMCGAVGIRVGLPRKRGRAFRFGYRPPPKISNRRASNSGA